MTTAHDFTLQAIDGTTLPLVQYRNTPILLVNTASKCGFTGQYADLQRLWVEFGPDRLTVIGVPSNDYGGQEPAEDPEILSFVQTSYGVTFPLAAKTSVKGATRHPLYTWLADQTSPLARPRWNFHKYLIGTDGHIADWFSSLTSPMSDRVVQSIRKVLSQ